MSQPHSGRQQSLICLLLQLEGQTMYGHRSVAYWNCPQSYSQCEPLLPTSHCGQIKTHELWTSVISAVTFSTQFQHQKHFPFGFISATPWVWLTSHRYESMNGYYHHMLRPPTMIATDWIIFRQLLTDFDICTVLSFLKWTQSWGMLGSV